MTTMPSMVTVLSTTRIASTAAPSAPSLSPRPIHRDAARAAASVTRTSSRARLRSGCCRSLPLMAGDVSGPDVSGARPGRERSRRPDGALRTAVADLRLRASSAVDLPYASEPPMCSLVAVLALVGFLATANAVEHASGPRLASVAVVTALLLYPHYWAVYLVAVTGA